jgi:tetratricopeptide (TPR) repeat protein
MTHPFNKKIGTVASNVSLVTIALFPLFLLPTTPNFYETNKLALLVVATGILLILYAARTIVTKTFRFDLLPLLLPLLFFGLIHFFSPFISDPKNLVEPLMNRAGFFLTLALFVATTTNLVQERRFIRQATYALIGSATVLSIISLFQSFGFGLSHLINQLAGTSLPDTLAFTPAGNIVALLSFLIPMVALSLVLAFTKTDAAEKVSLFVLSAIIASAVLVVAVYSLPGKETSLTLLPFQTGYAIAVETLKLPKTAIFGVGTQNFSSAFNLFKPNALNLTNLWNIRFGVSSTEILQLIATVGLLGTFAFVLILSHMVKLAKAPITGIQIRSLKVTAFTLAILFFLIPGSYVLYFAFAVILSLWSLAAKFAGIETIKSAHITFEDVADNPQTLKKIGVYAPAVLMIGVTGAALYLGSQVYAADITFKRSIDAATKNDGLTTYNLQRDAILKNPYLATYRRAYATTNLALANAIAGGENLTDQDRQNIAQLIQQAIREAKIAASISPNNVANWETLATIYRALINAAEGADQWTVAALAQAIQTDPTNPALRVQLGGIYYSLGAYDQAIRLFQQAAELKPDFTNAYYNLSHAYLQKQDVIAAYDYMRQTLSLTQPDSADYTKARQELEALSEKLPKQEAAAAQGQQPAPAQTTLETAPPAPTPTTEVDLPQNSGPENVDTTTPSIPSGDINP